ncbi:unnamed protein product [Rodentolepis nana]|uniref:Lysosomal trafficking regulator lyst n=1 Tax=Rodentolepis nana TaxID=102285 RepID=A0A0R3TA17_RODNA|nr:unnamed protein product [Rodentolepis nana]
MVLETDDGNDLIILNPSWVLTDAVGNLFSQDSISHARVTGSFTTDDLHFLISESDVGMVLEVLIALECCTIVKANVGQDQEPESPAQSEARKQSIHSFFEDAAAGTNNLQNSTMVEEELQMEIPRLNLIQPSDITEVWGCGGEDMIRTGIQFKGSGAQLIHVFPRIQCRLRRAASSLLKLEGLESQELVQWLLGSRLSYNKGLINICLICDETEEAIEVKLETNKTLIPLAFNCFHDILILVRGALDEIVSQLSISNCLLIFKTSTFPRVCKEEVSQPTLFHLLTDSDGVKFLELTIFMQNPQLRACCWFGGDIPASWIRYEVLLEICSELGKNDEFSTAQLKDLTRLLVGEEIGRWDENESYDSRLNRLLQLIVNWRDCSENPVVGKLVNALQAVGLTAIVPTLQENHPIAEIRHRAFDNVINKLKRGFLPPKSLSDIIDIVISNLQTERCNEILEFLHRLSMDVAGRAQLQQNNIIGILLSLISNPDLKESHSLIQEIVSNIVSELHEDANNGGSSRGEISPMTEPFQHSTIFFAMPNSHYSNGNILSKFTKNGSFSFHTADFVIEKLPSSSISQLNGQYISDYIQSLANTTDLTVLSKLGYFDSVILSDYPAEFFIRNPVFIQLLATFIVTSSSNRVQIASTKILINLCCKLITRISYFENLNNYSSTNRHVESLENSEINHYLKEFLTSAKVSEYLTGSLLPPCVINLPSNGVSIPVFAVAMANAALSGLVTVRSSTAFRSSLLHLLNKAVDLFLHCTQVDLSWRTFGSTTVESFKPLAESVLPSQNVTPGFDNMLELWGILLSTFSKSWRNDLSVDRQIDDFEQPRLIYIGLLKPLFRLLFSLWTPEACACLLPSMTSFEIALASLDCHFVSNFNENNSTDLLAYVRFFDPEIFLLHSKLMEISPAILASVDFIRSLENHQNFDLPNFGGMMTKAIEGLRVIEFIPNSYAPKFVSFLAETLLYADEPTCISLLSQSRPYLLMLLSHSNSKIRKITYDQIHEIISTSVSVENAANPTSQDYKRIKFLLNREVFGEIVEFGANDTVPEIATTAKACLRLLLDSHHLIPESMWLNFVNLIYEQPNDLNCLPYSTDWRPIQPFISLLAGLSAEINPSLEAFLGHGGFKNALTNSYASTIPLLYHPQPHTRRKAASLIVKTMDFTIKDCAQLYSSLDETLSDLLIITDPAMPISQAIFEELSCKILADGISSNHIDRKILIEAMELVGDGVADLGVRCNAAERVFRILTSSGNFELWNEANGPSILLDWVASLSAQLGLNIGENLLIEPLVRVLLGIAHYVIINDLKSRHHFYLTQSLFFKPILQVGLCFWQDLRIRRSVSIIIALIIFTPAIRISDE